MVCKNPGHKLTAVNGADEAQVSFVVQRMRCYERKLLDRMFFPEALAQYLAWKHGGRGGQVGGGRRQRG